MLIGRSRKCDVVVYDPSRMVSRRHLEVKTRPQGGLLVKDLSKNGSYIPVAFGQITLRKGVWTCVSSGTRVCLAGKTWVRVRRDRCEEVWY